VGGRTPSVFCMVGTWVVAARRRLDVTRMKEETASDACGDGRMGVQGVHSNLGNRRHLHRFLRMGPVACGMIVSAAMDALE
jgi:hypothetical protein